MDDRVRLHYVDWLRVVAFAILIVYHSSVAFFPGFDWLVQSSQKSLVLLQIMDFPRAWRLALLFFVSGMGTWFAYRSASSAGFLRERTARLLAPLLFAMCVIVVPQVWIERVMNDGYRGSLLAFWIERYFTEGKYPAGNFTWAHMWFVGYLLVMSFVCYPIFALLDRPFMRPVTDWFERAARSDRIYLLFLLPLALNLALTPFFPRQTNALYNDGAWFAVWASWFGLGFLVARHHAAVIDAIVARRHVSAAAALTVTAYLYAFSFTRLGGRFVGSYEVMTPMFKTLIFALAWTMILAFIGYAARHLNKGSAALRWLNRKIFPLYIAHQTVVLLALYLVLPLEAGVWTTYGLVLAITIAGSLFFAVTSEALPDFLKPLVGLTSLAPKQAQAASRPVHLPPHGGKHAHRWIGPDLS
jgi:glucan biosynthesis protein C